MQGRAEKVYAKNSKQQAYLHPDERDEVQEEWLGGLAQPQGVSGHQGKGSQRNCSHHAKQQPPLQDNIVLQMHGVRSMSSLQICDAHLGCV
jgi:hypothetical protein